MLRIIKTEPALAAGVVQAVISLAVGLGLHLTAGQTGALEAATSAVLAAVVAFSARPVQVSAFTGALAAVGTVLVAFGVPHVTGGSVSSLNAVLVAVLALVLRGHVTPVANAPKAQPVKM